MAGKKGASGGARKAVRADDARGGAQRGQGAHRRNVHLSKAAAASLRILLRNRQGFNRAVTEDMIVEELIEAAWQEYDQRIMRDVEKAEAWEGEIL